jgi:mannose-6-phosphate isomerase-like protein (cupin superfamily)
VCSSDLLGNILVVGVNSDAWLTRKKGAPFMPLLERTAIIRELGCVDFVIDFNDADNTAKHAIQMVRQSYPQDQIIFANGGDRTDKNIPEMDVADTNTKFVFGVGGFNKANSSSWILQEWKAPKTERPWGYYRVLHEVPGTKVKELTVNPGCTLSMQRHNRRAEYWQVSEGRCVVEGEGQTQTSLETHDSYHIPTNEWHRLYNPFDRPCRIVEIQYGPNCVEEDIERRSI